MEHHLPHGITVLPDARQTKQAST